MVIVLLKIFILTKAVCGYCDLKIDYVILRKGAAFRHGLVCNKKDLCRRQFCRHDFCADSIKKKKKEERDKSRSLGILCRQVSYSSCYGTVAAACVLQHNASYIKLLTLF